MASACNSSSVMHGVDRLICINARQRLQPNRRIKHQSKGGRPCCVLLSPLWRQSLWSAPVSSRMTLSRDGAAVVEVFEVEAAAFTEVAVADSTAAADVACMLDAYKAAVTGVAHV